MENLENVFNVSQAFYLYLAFKGIDQVTGLFTALHTKTFQSNKMRDGIFRVGYELILIFMVKLINYAFKVDLNLGACVCAFFILKDIFSIVENVGKAGVKLPDFIMVRMVSLQEFVVGKEKIDNN